MTNRAFWWKQVCWGSAFAFALASCFWATGSAQAPATPDWTAVEAETMRHFQAVLRLDTGNPPGNETLVAEYVKAFFDREGIPAKLLSRDPKRANVVARLKGSGRKRPILLMGHTDVVTVDPTKWQHPPFSATREGGYVSGRGSLGPSGTVTRLDSEGFKAVEAAVSRVYGVTTVPMMLAGATDMAQVRAKGVQCIGVGPAFDLEDGPKGFASHSDQERILESELHRFVRFMYDVVTTLARAS